jgi:hypothetical protein
MHKGSTDRGTTRIETAIETEETGTGTGTATGTGTTGIEMIGDVTIEETTAGTTVDGHGLGNGETTGSRQHLQKHRLL